LASRSAGSMNHPCGSRWRVSRREDGRLHATRREQERRQSPPCRYLALALFSLLTIGCDKRPDAQREEPGETAALIEAERNRKTTPDASQDSEVPEGFEALLVFDNDAKKTWPLVRRRLSALKNNHQFDDLEAAINKAATVFPKREEQQFLRLARSYEGAGRYADARRIYNRIINAAASGEAIGQAAWFFTTAPDPFKDHIRATELLWRTTPPNPLRDIPMLTDSVIQVPVTKGAQKRFDGRAAAALSELWLVAGDVPNAIRVLESFPHSSAAVSDQLKRVRDGDIGPLRRPRGPLQLPVHAAFKVPPEWRESIPSGPFTDDERLLMAELEAIRLSKKGEHAQALSYYRALIERAKSPFVANTFRLGQGRVLERRGPAKSALQHYESTDRLHGAEDPRMSNRLAWFLITADSISPGKRKRGIQVAMRAIAATESLNPAALDTLAEGYIRQAQPESLQKANDLLKKCVAMDPERSYFRRRLEKLQTKRKQRTNVPARTDQVVTREFSGDQLEAMDAALRAPDYESEENDEDRSRAADLIKEANTNYNRGEFRDALRDYQRAFRLSGDPRLVYRIGLTYENLANYKRAHDYLQRSLRENPSSEYTGRVARKLTHLKTLEKSMQAFIDLSSEPTGARIFLDGDGTLGVTPQKIPVGPGPHEVTLAKQGLRTSTFHIEVSSGETVTKSYVMPIR
jgi:tetratricopeptide (TPR) repeat protein